MINKVALINPGRKERFDAHEPLNIGFIASFLEKNGIETKIIDELSGDNVEHEIEEFNPGIAGITATTPFALDAYRHAEMCRKRGITAVMGGVHASIMTEEALRYVDAVVKGEGELAMLDIALRGVRDNKIITLPHIKDLDAMPLPAYHLMNMDFYLAAKERTPYDTALIFVPPGYKVASMLTSRGCPFSCAFCHNTWKGIPFRSNSAERVIEDIKYLKNAYQIQAITFFDDDFFANKLRVRKICSLMKESNLNIIWGCNSRVNSIDPETLQAAREAGCRQVAFGFESGSQKILDILNKRTTAEQNKKAVKLCKEAGLLCIGFFMLGNPDETAGDIELTRKFILENPIDCIGLCISTPFPGTKLWDWCQEKGFIAKDLKWSDFSPDSSPIRVSQFVSPDEAKRLRSKIFLDYSLKQNSLLRFFKMSLRYPLQALRKAYRIFRHLLR